MIGPRFAMTVLLGVTLLAGGAAGGPSVDLLKSQDLWTLEATASEVYSFSGGQLAAKRRTYQSATVLTKEDYENFDLSFEYLLKRDCELIFLVHAPRNGAYEAGLELVLSDHHGRPPGPFVAGALLNRVPPSKVTVNEEGEWNACSIHFDWPRFTATLNGERIQDLDLTGHEDLRFTLRRGALGFRDLLGWGFEVRGMRLTPLTDSENGITLYNGRNLDGWKEVRPGDARWRAQGPVLLGENGNGYLQHEREVQDFDLRLYYRTSPTANGGVFFRWKTDDSDRGNEIQILDVAQASMPSGSIYNIARADASALFPVGSWQLLQLSMRGNRGVTLLNGIRAAETDRLTKVWPGHITLQMHKEKSTIAFKEMVLVPRDGS